MSKIDTDALKAMSFADLVACTNANAQSLKLEKEFRDMIGGSGVMESLNRSECLKKLEQALGNEMNERLNQLSGYDG